MTIVFRLILRGAVAGSNTVEATERLAVLRDEISRLDEHEKRLEQHRQWCQQSLSNVTDDQINQKFAYVRSDDISASFDGETSLAIKAPSETTLEVPMPEERGAGAAKKKYQIHLKSTASQIYVLLVNKDEGTEAPLVVPVPLSQEAQEAMDSISDDNNSPAAAATATRRSGRGKAKATSPPAKEDEGPQPAKKIKSEASEASLSLSEAVEQEQRRRDAEVENILRGPLDTHIEGLEDILSNESKFNRSNRFFCNQRQQQHAGIFLVPSFRSIHNSSFT